MPTSDERATALSMPEFGAAPRSHNGRPLRTHDRVCNAELHAGHKDSVCEDCGCCWGCVGDCCAEYACPNSDCGCSLALRTAVAAPASTTAEDPR